MAMRWSFAPRNESRRCLANSMRSARQSAPCGPASLTFSGTWTRTENCRTGGTTTIRPHCANLPQSSIATPLLWQPCSRRSRRLNSRDQSLSLGRRLISPDSWSWAASWKRRLNGWLVGRFRTGNKRLQPGHSISAAPRLASTAYWHRTAYPTSLARSASRLTDQLRIARTSSSGASAIMSCPVATSTTSMSGWVFRRRCMSSSVYPAFDF